MTYAGLLTQLGQALEEVGEEALALELAFCHVKGWTKTDLVLNQRTKMTEADRELLNQLYQQLAAHKPYQYIIGQAEFRNLTLAVDERVLIPRPETEELVEVILAENPQSSLSILDIGTGSGAIALSLKAERPDWQVTASDISEEALTLAQENAGQLGLEITVVQSDVFEQLEGRFDVIVSNPPYIAHEDKDEVGLNVLTSEPHLALFADEEGYQIYRRIIEGARQHLKPHGKLYFEIGYKQGQGLLDLVGKNFPSKRVRILQDVFGRDRMVVVDDR